LHTRGWLCRRGRAEIGNTEGILGRGRSGRSWAARDVARPTVGTHELAGPGDLELDAAATATHDHDHIVPSCPILLTAMDTSVVVVGDEILSGHVQDANAAFIATRIAHHGHRLRRIVIVSDDPLEISAELRRELAGPASLVFVCGGLGPTHDDRTMEGVASALGTTLAEQPGLAARIEEIISSVGRSGFSESAFGVEGLRKMALAPMGAEILPTSIGVIPAVTVEHAGKTIVILPGPPRELQTVFTETVEPRFLEGTGMALWREELTHRFPESTFALVLTELQSKFPGTSIGSYPQRDHTLIRIAGPNEEAQLVAEQLRAHLTRFAESDEGKRLLEFMSVRRHDGA